MGGWRSRSPEGLMQLTPFPHPKEKAIRSECTASLPNSRPPLADTLYFQCLPIFLTSFIK